MTQAAPKEPLRYSIVVLSYNQAPFVRDAVEGALAQDCPPLEIIISDDCSTDGTFDIIQDTIRGYDGPHRVTARQNPQNIGLVAHINAMFDVASGDVLIPAYGDDISLPNRAAEIMKTFDAEAPLLVHSDATAIDPEGHETATTYRKADFFRTTDPLDTATSMAVYLGASGAWHRDLFTKYGPLKHPNIYDDHVFGFRAALEGRVSFIEKPLLKYREGIGLSHQLKQDRNAGAARDRRRKILNMMVAAFSQRLDDATTFGLATDHPIMRKLAKARRKATLRAACYDGIGRMILRNLHQPGAALTAAGAEGLRILRGR
ncbi:MULTISPECIES: glycosyltransferase [unclassified Roseovarius]|uniref:glycosyltransferase n=1 Tax=unclassified Roseovarius TaxID=2614913 RepID=UPI00273ED524|nr:MULTISPECIES: glycosyltransferase [unclassified Roseovarius]